MKAIYSCGCSIEVRVHQVVPSVCEQCRAKGGFSHTSTDAKPDAPEWNGEGRPPVNTKCKAVSCHKLRTGTVVWHREGSDVDALVLDEDGFTAFWADTFAPLKTQAEREHEELAELLYNHGMVNRDCDPAADAIIAAGWRKGE